MVVMPPCHIMIYGYFSSKVFMVASRLRGPCSSCIVSLVSLSTARERPVLFMQLVNEIFRRISNVERQGETEYQMRVPSTFRAHTERMYKAHIEHVEHT